MVQRPLYPPNDPNGHSRSISLRVPLATYQQLNDLYEEVVRRNPNAFASFADALRYSLVLLCQSLTVTLGNENNITKHIETAEVLRRFNDTLEFGLKFRSILEELVKNIEEYEKRMGRRAATEKVHEVLAIARTIADKNLREEAIEFIETEFRFYLDTK